MTTIKISLRITGGLLSKIKSTNNNIDQKYLVEESEEDVSDKSSLSEVADENIAKGIAGVGVGTLIWMNRGDIYSFGFCYGWCCRRIDFFNYSLLKT